MAEYQKIQTLFQRDEKNIIVPDSYTYPEFEELEECMWECTEKIDGTNIRIELSFYTNENGARRVDVSYKGRTDNANIPEHLYKRLEELFDNVNWFEIFNVAEGNVTLYGEGYGAKIQKGGNYISKGVDFILFDVKINHWWLERQNIEDIAKKLGIRVVPFIGYFTLPQAIEFVRRGFKSVIAENKEYDAEGLVLKAPCGILRRNGERLMTKIKTVDFRKYEATHPKI